MRKDIKMIYVIISIIFVSLLIGLYFLGSVIIKTPFVARKEIVLNYNIKMIWDVVVNNNDYAWRSDVKNVEILDDETWKEFYDEAGKYFTSFTLREKNEYTLYSFDMKNKNFYGSWVGEFIELNENETKLVFSETIFIKNRIMGVLAKLFWNLEKIQKQYFDDLIKALERKGNV